MYFSSIRNWILTKIYGMSVLDPLIGIIGPGHAKTCLMPYANNKGADQPPHPRRLISTFIVRCLESVICILDLSKVSCF